ncbi:type III-B CRISPR-associated protein Cas10/Cmr2 [Chromatium weissei]|nr:type III-B CRISPR-associated protein Cas10/Cmr2 [Chromatium weissei]
MTKFTTFHFTLGPVQGFVSQARRTRDFWAGSFLLSWLAGAAMQAVLQQKGEINFPSPSNDYLNWLVGKGTGKAPSQGCIPNRFKAIQAKVPSDFNPKQIEDAVRKAWWALAESIWKRDLIPYLNKTAELERTRTIWERQCQQFWEIAWALGDDNALLDRRKNWRSQLPPEEAGVKCSMMAGWQELSGAAHPTDAQLNTFWKPLRERFSTDFDADEALCAIAFIKRRFVKGFTDLRVQMQNNWTLHGWKVNGQMPSTTDLAAAHWVAQLKDADSNLLAQLRTATEDLLGESDGGLSQLKCVGETGLKSLTHLHSSALFEHVLENKKLCSDRNKVNAVKHALKALGQKTSPSPFYAILLMDGDSLGQLLQSKIENAPKKISVALNQFTAAVPEIVHKHNGFLIYAGGDDVLALFPMEDALKGAAAIRACYLTAFQKAFNDKKNHSTISAAITFAHVKTPLTRLLHNSHHLLDEIAKDATGRDALAVRVEKGSGETIKWAQPWECALLPNSDTLAIEKIAEQFKQFAAPIGSKDVAFSNKFFYKIREQFELINPSNGQEKAVFTEEEAVSLLAVDYLASGVNDNRRDKLKIADAEALIKPLVEQCRPVTRHNKDGTVTFTSSNRLEPDGALLVRFLAQKGVEK